jgi:hypothetical protein
MFNQKRGPKWGILYLVLPLAAGLFWLQMQATLPETGHQVAEVGVVLLTYGLVELWLRANRLAILNEDHRGHEKSGQHSRIRVILMEDIPAEEHGDSPVEPALPPVVRLGANGWARVPRTLVTGWSSSDSGPLLIQHSRFDSPLNAWTAGEEE